MPTLKWKRLLGPHIVTKICVELPKADEVKQDHLESRGDKRPSRAMSVTKGFKDSWSQK